MKATYMFSIETDKFAEAQVHSVVLAVMATLRDTCEGELKIAVVPKEKPDN